MNVIEEADELSHELLCLALNAKPLPVLDEAVRAFARRIVEAACMAIEKRFGKIDANILRRELLPEEKL